MTSHTTRVGVFHPGTQHSWQTALAFQEANQLAWYATSVFYDPERWHYRIERWLPGGLGDRLGYEFRRRHTPLLNLDHIRLFGIDEWFEAVARRIGLRQLSHWFNVRGNIRFAAGVIRLIEREPVDTVWGYSLSSRDLFRWAKRRGIRCVLDQTIGHPRTFNRVMAEEYQRHPELFFSSQPPCDDVAIAMADEEVALADLVVVGSMYCYQSMIENGCPAEKLKIVPYGFDETLFPDALPVRRTLDHRPKDFLFVGSLDPRKGIAYLLKAFEGIDPNRATLTLVGGLGMPASTFKRYQPHVRHVPQLPRPEVVAHFCNADVFIFPSLFEGSALVLYEAIGAGLGIIQSAASGTGVSADSANGIVLNQVSVESVRAAIESVLDNPDKLQTWGKESWNLREQRSWRVYRKRARDLLIK